MINQTYRLIAPKQIRTDFVEFTPDKESIIVRPTWDRSDEEKIANGINT